MYFLYLVAFFVIIYLLITNKNSFNEKIQSLEDRILELQHLLKQGTEDKSLIRSVGDHATKSTIISEENRQEQIMSEEPLLKPVLPENSESREDDVIADHFSRIRRSIKTNSHHPNAVRKPVEPKLSFFDQYPDLEKFIGENLINKIGIAILVLAIGFFVKYAIDTNWIGPVGRVLIGVLCGGILIGLAHRLHHSYKAFSSVLVGGGLAILYFTTTLAYHQFHLFSQTVSFVILIIITCFAVALSLFYDKQELAVTALIGGLSSPFMVSGDQPNYNALFIYLIILNAGLLVIAYNKSWRILNASAFALTAFVFLVILFTLPSSTYILGFLYATILYLLFFSINIANNVRENKKFVVSDFTLLLINSALYFAVGLYFLIGMSQEQLRGLFAISLGIINLVLSYLLFKNKKVDSNILYLLVGIALTFLSLAAPIQLHGHYITLFWAAEAVMLYWFYQKSGIQLMRTTSLAIWGFMLISLWMDWLSIYDSSLLTITIIANKGFITTLVASISSYFLYILMRKQGTKNVYGIIEANWFKYSAFVLLFLSGLLEINHQFLNHYPDVQLNSLYLMLYVPAFIYISYMLSKRLLSTPFDWRLGMNILTVCIAAYLALAQEYFDVQYVMLTQYKVSTAHFVAHWLGAIFIALLFYQLILIVKHSLSEDFQKVASWILAGAIVIFLSLEICLVTNFLFYSEMTSIDRIQTIYIKVGLPILWGLASFVLMWLGMRRKMRTLRIISLTLFSITLFKLFVFDIQNIPPAGKIVAFFCLGVLLLIISFMYQKVKRIIIQGAVSE